ncbi:hypothetical protein ASH00_03485 [Arthrobacter sp. Soil782]|nr:hypothetical protein ASH00_03485 [Arthrobacter sp. Soil782]
MVSPSSVLRLHYGERTLGNSWDACRELQEEGSENLPVPSNFPLKKEERSVSYQYRNFSDGKAAAEGSWASGPAPDGKGEFT